MPPKIDPDVGCIIPDEGDWPVDPQHDQTVQDDRLWIDGCFDFFHHGHTGVMLQSRRLGNELLVGLHTDEEIAMNKGPTVMSLAERVAAVEACRFTTKCVPSAPYVTSVPWISHYGCRFVTHGDDITSDADGNDCYRFVKQAGRMKIVPRTPGISTTDLVNRMLLCTKDHFISSLAETLADGGTTERVGAESGAQMLVRLREYAAAPNGLDPYVDVFTFQEEQPLNGTAASNGHVQPATAADFKRLVAGHGPRPGQRVVYVDGGFDLFSSGHIAFLEAVTETETKLGAEKGWYEATARQARGAEEYEPAYVVAGIHADRPINERRGINYPIMNILERGLCVVQCQYVHAVVFGAPLTPDAAFLAALPSGSPDAVYHGATASMLMSTDPYADARALGIFATVPSHRFADVDAAHIVRRILTERERYEERQRKKGLKVAGEEAHHRRELLEREQADRERQAAAGE